MSITVKIGFAIVHLAMAVFLAATSIPVLRPSLGLWGTIGILVVVDLHAFLQAAYWAQVTPGKRNFNFYLVIGLTLVSGFISFYGADLTARIFEPDSKIDTVQAKINHYRDSIARVNQDRMLAYNRQVQIERDRVQREKERIRQANQEQIKVLQEQANGLRWNNHVTTSGKLAVEIAKLSRDPEVATAEIPRPILLEEDGGYVGDLQRRIEETFSRRQLYKTAARTLEVTLVLVLILYMFSQREDARANLFVKILDALLSTTWLARVVEELEGETNRNKPKQTETDLPKQPKQTETNSPKQTETNRNKPSQLTENELVTGETTLFREKPKQPKQTETDLPKQPKQIDTIVSEKPAINFMSSRGKTVILWNGERWDRSRIRQNWRSNLNNYRKRGDDKSLERAIRYWELWCELMKYTGEEISVDDQLKMNKILKAS